MQNKNLGILLYSKPIKDNDLFVKFLLKNDQLISGIVYGGNSSKKINIYQLGYYLNLNLNKKNLNSPYIIDAEISSPLIGSIIEDKYKLYCLLSIVSLINLSIIEGQNIKGIFKCVDEFIYNLINKKKWIELYCKWLFNLLKVIGYEIDYQSNCNKLFFDVKLLEFTNNQNNFSFSFPHDFLKGNIKVTHSSIDKIFIIFEYIFKNNHLNNINYKLPGNYINFKKLILEYLIKN